MAEAKSPRVNQNLLQEELMDAEGKAAEPVSLSGLEVSTGSDPFRNNLSDFVLRMYALGF